MIEWEKSEIENLLIHLNERGILAPDFKFYYEKGVPKMLGYGGFSVVYEVVGRNNEENHYALKILGFNKHKQKSEDFWNTVEIVNKLSKIRTNIVEILFAREILLKQKEEGEELEVLSIRDEINDNNDTETEGIISLQYVIMEKLEPIINHGKYNNKSLNDEKLKDENNIIEFAIQIGNALKRAHEFGVFHRDVKLENVFWSKKEEKYLLGDFGVAKCIESGEAETVIYTDGYGAPEIRNNLTDKYSNAADIYSFGIMLYLLLNNLKFPCSDSYHPVVNLQYDPNSTFPAPINASPKITRIVRKMTEYYLEDRYQSMDDVIEAFEKINEDDESGLTYQQSEEYKTVTETYREPYKEIIDKPKKNYFDFMRIDRALKTSNSIITEHEEKNNELSDEDSILESEYDYSEEESSLDYESSSEDEEKNEVQKQYIKLSIFFLIFLTINWVLCLKSMRLEKIEIISSTYLWILPVLLLAEFFFQLIDTFDYIFGVIVLFITVKSIITVGLTFVHVIVIVCLTLGTPVITASGAFAIILWMQIEKNGMLEMLDIISRLDIGWIFLGILCVGMRWSRNFKMIADRILIGKKRKRIIKHISTTIGMVAVGAILALLQKTNVIDFPDVIKRMHVFLSGVIFTSLELLVEFKVIEEMKNHN